MNSIDNDDNRSVALYWDFENLHAGLMEAKYGEGGPEALNMPSKTASRRVFASYSRKDARLVHELVRLIRITDAPVFLDVDSIQAGDRWRIALESAIRNADLIAVFWSLNASTSEEVAREYRFALEQGKPIVPVVLDDSLLPDELAQFQGIVLADLLAPHDGSFDPQPYVRQVVVRFLANG